MASFGLSTSLSSLLPQPSDIFLQLGPVLAPLISNGEVDPPRYCKDAYERILCSDIPNLWKPAGSAAKGASPAFGHPLTSPMPFAESLSAQPTVTITFTVSNTPATIYSTLPVTLATSASSATHKSTIGLSSLQEVTNTHITGPVAQSTLSLTSQSVDPMMVGNPDPKRPKWRVPVIIGVAIVSMLGLSIVPLLIFSLAMKIKLKRAIKQQLRQGPRRHVAIGFDDSEQIRRERAVEGRFLIGFRKRIHDRAFAGRSWV